MKQLRLNYPLISFFTIIGISLFIVLVTLVRGNIPFWYDPARDLLLGLDNMRDITFIGPTSGIPGLFYGPYWIWLLSVGLFISKDPRIVSFIVLAIPYLLIVPFIFYRLRSVLGQGIVAAILSLFLLQFGIYYATQLWNPHLAPFLAIICIYLLTFWMKDSRAQLLHQLLIGFICGLLLNFHISFGLGFSIGIFIFIMLDLVTRSEVRKNISQKFFLPLFIFIIGFSVAFSPFFLFEIKNNFQQLRVIQQTLLSESSVVAVTGMSKLDVIVHFFSRLQLPGVPKEFISLLLIVLIIIFSVLVAQKKIMLTGVQKRLLLIILCTAGSILAIYLLSKNPVWNYHFIGVELLLLLFLGLVAKHIRLLQYAFVIWALIIGVDTVTGTLQAFAQQQPNPASLAAKEHVVMTIFNDAKDNEYAVIPYTPAVYSYDFAYLFQTKTAYQMSYRPELINKNSQIIYLIFSDVATLLKSKKSIYEDFIHYNTPENNYTTSREWRLADGTLIIKRERQETQINRNP
jgi:hypothetical protein